MLHCPHLLALGNWRRQALAFLEAVSFVSIRCHVAERWKAASNTNKPRGDVWHINRCVCDMIDHVRGVGVAFNGSIVVEKTEMVTEEEILEAWKKQTKWTWTEHSVNTAQCSNNTVPESTGDFVRDINVQRASPSRRRIHRRIPTAYMVSRTASFSIDISRLTIPSLLNASLGAVPPHPGQPRARSSPRSTMSLRKRRAKSRKPSASSPSPWTAKRMAYFPSTTSNPH